MGAIAINSQILTKARISSFKSIYDMANLANVSVNEYQAFERGSQSPNAQQCVNMLLACGLSQSQIMTAALTNEPKFEGFTMRDFFQTCAWLIVLWAALDFFLFVNLAPVLQMEKHCKELRSNFGGFGGIPFPHYIRLRALPIDKGLYLAYPNGCDYLEEISAKKNKAKTSPPQSKRYRVAGLTLGDK